MNKPRHPVIVILVTLVAAALIAVRYHFGLGCVIYEWLGFPCITCGMTRAVLSAARLDFRAAFRFHPMFWSLPVLYWTVVTELKPFKSRTANLTVNISLLSGFVITYAIRLAGQII